MKIKAILSGILFLLAIMSYGQENLEGAQVVTPSQAIQTSNASGNYTIQVGLPILGQNKNSSANVAEVTPLDLRFPWDVLYLFNTFEENSFEVSKGFFGDKILVNWELRNNLDQVESLKLYRREYTEDNSNTFKFITNLAPNATSYDDLYVDGGILYEYKLFAQGVADKEALYTNYITGIGFRNPTAIVTGNVTFEGGNPVKDVIIKARSSSSEFNYGSGLVVPVGGALSIDDINKPITDQMTFQAWVKPVDAFTSSSGPFIQLFELKNGSESIKADINFDPTSNQLSINAAGSTFTISNYIPSGKTNARGDDILIPISNFNSTFTHVSIQLEDGKDPQVFINGRPMTANYQTLVNEALIGVDVDYKEPYFKVDKSLPSTALTINGEWSKLNIGGNRKAYVDEIRAYKTIKSPEFIRANYSRYIGGNDSSMIVYLRANEGVGEFAYDLSRNGFNYNKNDGKLATSGLDKVLWGSSTENFPDESQLGILGITDENGNYEINAIPYTGNGESFKITPIYGQHEFDPGQQIVFLGKGSEVVNQIDFTDKSAFNFNGQVLYDTRDVFPSFVELNGNSLNNLDDGDQYISGPGIIDEGYNYFEKSGEKFPKGEYWYNSDKDRLERYARVGLEGANVYVDGDIVLDENNSPVETDGEGKFSIDVPIGNHFITVKKNGHEFTANGRFPAASGSTDEFFQDRLEPVYFIDQTRVTVVGKVVGGSVEAEKPVGFGEDGIATNTVTNSQDQTETVRYSSKNNIGTATLTFGHRPASGSITNATRFTFETNEASGEYRVEVMPLQYKIKQSTGVRIDTNTSIALPETNETLNYEDIPESTIPTFDFPDGNVISGQAYQYEKSFIYRSTPVLRVTSQESDENIILNEEEFSTKGFNVPVLTQFKRYNIELRNFERYENYDNGPQNPVEDVVPVIDGELLITNNQALKESETVTRDEDDLSLINYSFRAGKPAIAKPFTRDISIRYLLNGTTQEAENYFDEAIILGGESDGSQTQVTKAPDVPDIILRDPPGSSSFATIEKGTSISLTKSVEKFVSNEFSASTVVKAGVKFEIGGGVTGPTIETQPIANVEQGLTLTNTSETGNDVTNTYTFNQSISTSDDSDFVGSEGDLYIGNSSNYSYGSYDNVQTVSQVDNNKDVLTLTNNDSISINIQNRKAYYFVEEPTETFFVYSQKFILENLIPQLEDLIEGINNTSIDPSEEGVLSIEDYQKQIYLWRKTIQRNERLKYEVLNSPDNALASAVASAQNQGFNDQVVQLVKSNFEKNITFDSGVGEINRTSETSLIAETSQVVTTTAEAGVSTELGLLLNQAGAVVTIANSTTGSQSASTSTEDLKTTTISYTLKDSDKDNTLSVNVYNMFDGYGPVFSTLGGATSCPYEGAEESLFFQASSFDPDKIEIEPLPEDTGELLGFGTQQVERVGISVEKTPLVNIPESSNAEFVLLLENTSATETDGNFLLKVDNTTNPNNAITNIDENGTIVSVPYGEQIPFALTIGKSISDEYDYEDIKITLQSLCDDNISESVSVSAFFVPSCSKVTVNAPLNNFSFNRDVAYNIDNTTNALNVQLGDFNTDFDSFQKIDLEYRSAGSPTWNRLHTYYATQKFYDEAQNSGQTDIELISDSEINYNFDIVDRNLGDGAYEIRARSTCTNGTEFISEPVTGNVDLNSPQKFGTPFPLNGIYATGSDLKARFSEGIFYNSAVSLLEIKGETNQLPVKNEVSLFFKGANNDMLIENPGITNGDLSIEFWMNNQTTANNATIMTQSGGIDVRLEGNKMLFNLSGVTASGLITDDDLFHHYTLTYNSSNGKLEIIEEDKIIDSVTANANAAVQNNNNIRIGGNTFIGNLSQLRFWNKPLTKAASFAMMYSELIGNEAGLTAYYPLDEGRGNVAQDKARFKDAVVSAEWDIKPKGNSYTFTNGGSLTLDNVGFAQLTPQMDATISFWMKTNVSQEATIFSNGKGDGTDADMPNGFDNKWSINLSSNGNLSFNSEGMNLPLTNQSVVDNKWHHVSIRLNRLGSMRTYVDQDLVSTNPVSDIGGFSGNTAYFGVRAYADAVNNVSFDRAYQGKLDEFRLWNTLRTNDQEERDAYEEIDPESIGLMIYSRFNEPEPSTGNGPRYYHAFRNNTIIPTNAIMESGTTAYSQDSPAIKPARELIKLPVNHVINGDEIILEPQVNSFAEIEGQILDVTIHRLFDSANNQQQSPVTWSVFVQKNDVDWFAEGFNNDVVDITTDYDQEEQFELTIVNRGGANQPFNILNIPSWLKLSATSGTISPASQTTITATIDALLDPGVYTQDLRLSTDFGLDQVQLLNVRVLGDAPDWTVDPTQFEHSMNIIGILKIDGQISEDEFDKIAAFNNGEVRGATTLEYNTNYEQSFAFLTLYSNQASGENITFKVWDASTGNIIQLELDDTPNLTFLTNEVIGSLKQPAVFSNTNVTEKEFELNAGWNWMSLNIEDPNASNLNELTSNMNLETSDLILSSAPARLDTYFKNQDGSGSWSGSISAMGGLKTDFMYKIYLHNPQTLKLSGSKVDMSTYDFEIKQNWNWLSFPLLQNVQLPRALSNFNPTEGDVIKSQNLFAIYDKRNGWSGTLKFLEQGKGYMLSSSTSQQFSYPASILQSKSLGRSQKGGIASTNQMDERFYKYPENMNAIVELPDSYNKLYIYDNTGTLKGYGENQKIGKRELTFVTIYGEKTENLNYYVGYDESDLTKATNLLNFKSNKILGKVNDPVVLKLEQDTITNTDDFILYPNPFDERLVIKMTSEVSQSTNIELYSIAGKLVFNKQVTLKIGGNSIQINPNIPPGTYFLRTSNNTTTKVRKVIKK